MGHEVCRALAPVALCVALALPARAETSPNVSAVACVLGLPAPPPGLGGYELDRWMVDDRGFTHCGAPCIGDGCPRPAPPPGRAHLSPGGIVPGALGRVVECARRPEPLPAGATEGERRAWMEESRRIRAGCGAPGVPAGRTDAAAPQGGAR